MIVIYHEKETFFGYFILQFLKSDPNPLKPFLLVCFNLHVFSIVAIY